MNRLADEILQLIVNELDFYQAAAFSQVSKRLLALSQDPYVRALYFLSRYGKTQALFWALGRGKLMNERVLDILLSSGAHLSRYIVQLAIHHYFRSNVHFIKSPWVRTLSFPMFSYFMKIAGDHLGNMSVTKGEDDGAVFLRFVKENRLTPSSRTVKIETMIETLEKYKFIPFYDKDPIMTQFPLALAIEPRLLPLAVANGFHMDSRYRDFVFRRMFEHTGSTTNERVQEILHNVRELCRLDSSMFVSRTVAAEVCMEPVHNAAAYSAIKVLDRKSELKFELATMVEQLIKLFVCTRSVTSTSVIPALRRLYQDFPSKDPTVRLVMMLTVFVPAQPSSLPAHSDLENLKLTPLSRDDLFNLLLNPFIERYAPIVSYAATHMGYKHGDINTLLTSVAVACLPLSSKGNMIKAIFHRDQEKLTKAILAAVTQYQVTLDSLPSSDNEAECQKFRTRLCRDLHGFRNEVSGVVVRGGDGEVSVEDDSPSQKGDVGDHREANDVGMEAPTQDIAMGDVSSSPSLSHMGNISQNTLSVAIRHDDLSSGRRRRWVVHGTDYAALLSYPPDTMAVGRWVRTQFGTRHPIMAVFMTHAVINDPSSLLHYYLSGEMVPITLMHFKILARLGRAPNYYMYNAIQEGAEFLFSDDDYLGKIKPKVHVKEEKSIEPLPSSSPGRASTSNTSPSSPRTRTGSVSSRKRPRRSAATSVRSYAVPDSDDDVIAEEVSVWHKQPKRKVESDLTLWIRHLTVLLKDEQRKFNERKRQAEGACPPGVKLRFGKNEFLKSMTASLRDLRKMDATKHQQGLDILDDDFSEGEDGEYQHRGRPAKRRKT
ncbi:hypothetical protein OF83DRAFT_1119562, partial [Amylostereum chailletii]